MSGFKIVGGSNVRYTLHSLYLLNAQDNIIHCPPRPLERQGGFVGLAVVETGDYVPGVWAVVFGFPPNSESPLVGITDKFDSQFPLIFSFSDQHNFQKEALSSRTAKVNIRHHELAATLTAVIMEDKLIGNVHLSAYHDGYYEGG
jgi:hypothetical protein